MQDERLTKDIGEDFWPALAQVALDLTTEDSTVSCLDMMSVMMSESGVSATAHNNGPPGADDAHQYHASGLIQFMPNTLVGLGWFRGHAAFRLLNATQQLPYVRKYYMPYKGYLHSIGGLYTATFLPALIKNSNDPDFILSSKTGPLPWAYAPNKCFDANNDGKITVGELEEAVKRNCHGPRWEQLVARLNGYAMGTDDDEPTPETQPE